MQRWSTRWCQGGTRVVQRQFRSRPDVRCVSKPSWSDHQNVSVHCPKLGFPTVPTVRLKGCSSAELVATTARSPGTHMKSEAPKRNIMTSDQVANQLLERMQQSGERDRIKEWLMNDLETTGWTSALLEKVTQLRSSNEKAASENTSAVDASSSSQSDQLTVRRISSQLSKDALASVPDSVRAKLMQELLDICRQYVTSENFGSSTPKGNK